METEINIAEILKDKPEGTKLYSPLFGNVYLLGVYNDGLIKVKHHDGLSIFQNNGRYYNYSEAELLLFPSKEMQDWSKFAWKKGDVLVSNDGDRHIIFKGFLNADYTTFKGKYWISVSKKRYVPCWNIQSTQDYHIENNKEAAQTYINTIEEKLGGKLNLETLEIENQLEFKDGDIIVTDAVPSLCYSKCIFILKGDLYTSDSSANSYVFYNVQNDKIHFNVLDENIRKRNIRLATDSEKQQLFSALKKEGELKPFDDTPVKDTKWHLAKEAPNYEEWIVIEWYDKDDGGTKYETNYLYCFMHWKDYVKRDNITKWCYIKDIK